jgi:hypothetical protein
MTAPEKPRRRPQGQKSTETFYHWFQGASVRELYERIGAAGPDTARLEVHQDGESMTFRVKAAGGSEITATDDPGDINDSRRCPPICQ